MVPMDQPREGSLSGSYDVIRPAAETELPLISALLERANQVPYRLATVTAEKCFGSGFSGSPDCRVSVVDGRIIGVAVTCGTFLRILAVDPGLRRRGIGSALLSAAEKRVSEAHNLIRVSDEAGNYFVPGIWNGDAPTLAFFDHCGYRREPQTAINLEVSLRANPLLEVESPASVRRATHKNREQVLTFVRETFGRIWSFECEGAFRHDEPTLFIAEDEDGICGFSAHEANNRGLGFFGPAGVGKAARKRGFGKALLVASLRDLRTRGFDRATIAWASSVEFYEKSCGAKPGPEFVLMRKELQSDKVRPR